MRERTDKLGRKLVVDDPGPSVPFVLMKPKGDVDYEAKAVKLAGRRCIPGSKRPGTSRNLDQMRKDAADRATIIVALERQWQKGDKSLEQRPDGVTSGMGGWVSPRSSTPVGSGRRAGNRRTPTA